MSDDLQLLVVHLPPNNADSNPRAQTESVAKLIKAMHRAPGAKRPRLAVGDFQPGPRANELAVAIDGVRRGDRLDCVVAKNLKSVRVKYLHVVNGVVMRSDHPHAMLVSFKYSWLGRRHYVWFYNLRVGRDPKVVNLELGALATWRKSKALAIAVCEAVGYDLPDLIGYDKVRDRSDESRANVALWTKKGKRKWSGWIDLKVTWSRNQHAGVHPPRSYIDADVAR